MAESHVRIDEGIPRGPKIRNGIPTRPSPKPDLGTWHIPTDLDPDHVLDRYLTDSTTSQIAGQIGVSRKALVKWLREQRPQQWREVQLIRAHCRLDDGEDGIEGSCDALSLARARETVKAAQFRLTALDEDYRPKQEVVFTGESFSDVLARLSAKLLQEKVVESLPNEVDTPALGKPDE